MQRRSIFLVVAVIIAAILIIFQANRRGVFGRGNTAFAVPPGTEITRIEMASNEAHIELKRDGNIWLVNGAGEARKSAVSFLIQTLQEIAIKSPVSDDLFRAEVTEKGVAPVRVKVWSGRKLIRNMLVYKTESNQYGNIMQLGAGRKPFIVSIPGFEGTIGSNFNMNDLFWRPFTIFSTIPSEIESVEVKYFMNPDESFLVYNPSTAVPAEMRGQALAGYDTARVKRYLSYFTWVPFESWAFNLTDDEQALIAGSPPLAVITLTSGGELSGRLTLWERADSLTGKIDTDRAWGRTEDNSNIFIVRYFDIDPLLRRKSYFFSDE
jgi:hypothetical protein